MNIEINNDDRKKLYRLTETDIDPVQLIAQKAQAYDALKLIVKAYLGADESSDIDLTMTFTLLIKKLSDDKEALQNLTIAVQKNAILVEQLKHQGYERG